MPSVFIVGPGYVGREIIDRFREGGEYDVTTLVRRDKAVQEFKQDSVTAHLGDLDDHDLIKKLASSSDIVFHTATSDHLASAKAILAGIRERVQAGKKTIYIHQSGASVLSDHQSAHENPKIYNDMQPAEIDTLSDDAPHRQIDLTILAARKEFGSMAKIFIMMPPIIYGTTHRQRLSIQIPVLTRFALKHGYAGYVSAGAAKWGTVHVSDLADGYMLIVNWLLKASDDDQELENPYFFANREELSWKQVSEIIGEVLKEQGKVDDAVPKEIPEKDWEDLFGKFTPDVIGCNSRCRSERLKKLGWKPKGRNVKDAFAEEDLPQVIREGGFKKSTLTLS